MVLPDTASAKENEVFLGIPRGKPCFSPYSAEREGFEPSDPLIGSHGFSKPAHSTTLPPLQTLFFRYFLTFVTFSVHLNQAIDTGSDTGHSQTTKNRLCLRLLEKLAL